MNMLGLDLSLNETGYCVLDEKGEIRENGVIKPKKESSSRIEKILETKMFIDNLIKLNSIEVVFLESYSYGSRNSSWMFSAGELGGIIKVLLYELKKEFYLVSPTMWKKFVVNNGHAKKEQVLLQCYKKFGKEFDNNNVCDAFCLAKFGFCFLDYKSGNTNYNKYEVETFKKMLQKSGDV